MIADSYEYGARIAQAFGIRHAKRIVIVLEQDSPVMVYVQQYAMQEQMDALLATPVPAGVARVVMVDQVDVRPDGDVVAHPAMCERCQDLGRISKFDGGSYSFLPCPRCRLATLAADG